MERDRRVVMVADVEWELDAAEAGDEAKVCGAGSNGGSARGQERGQTGRWRVH